MDSAAGEEGHRPLRVFFIPFFATGHMIPLVDISLLFAARGVDSTLLVTPANAALIQRTVDRAADAGLPIRTLIYPFPSAESGLPPGVENISHLAPSESHLIDAATPHVRPAHDRLLRLHRPDAVVSDIHFPWTTAIARDLGSPRVRFDALGAFPNCVMSNLFDKLPHVSVSDDAQPFLVPGLPHPIYMVRPELPDFLRSNYTHIATIMKSILEAESGSFGVVVNSFAKLDSAYADCYSKTSHLKLWLVGPVSLAYGDDHDKAARGGDDPAAAANRLRCLGWLDSKEAGSVLYVAFGSWSRFSDEQLRAMALGLEAAGHPFLWVVRDEGNGGKLSWMPEGFEERVEGRGLVVRGWAPQAAVLGHPSVGGFVTHCGWNSVLEGVSAGLPMATLPLSTEQFINEKLVVGVLGIGVRTWEGRRGTAEDEQVVVTAEEIRRAVGRIMGGGEEAEGMRRRTREYAEAARAAVKEGGSSYEDLSSLIEEIRAFHRRKSDGGSQS